MGQKNNKGQIITFVIYGLAFLLIVVLPISLAIKIGGQAKGLFIFMAIMAAVITGVLSSIIPKKRSAHEMYSARRSIGN